MNEDEFDELMANGQCHIEKLPMGPIHSTRFKVSEGEECGCGTRKTTIEATIHHKVGFARRLRYILRCIFMPSKTPIIDLKVDVEYDMGTHRYIESCEVDVA